MILPRDLPLHPVGILHRGPIGFVIEPTRTCEPPCGMDCDCACHFALAYRTMVARSTIHRCPPTGDGIMPCCGRTPFEIGRLDRMAVDDELVTCDGRTV